MWSSEYALSPRAYEVTFLVEDHHWMRAASENVYPIFRVHSYSGYIGERPTLRTLCPVVHDLVLKLT